MNNDLVIWIILNLTVLAGALLQGSLGFGFAMLVAPIWLFLKPELVPSTLLIVHLLVSLMILVRDHREIHIKGMTSALFGRGIGTVIAAVMLMTLSATGLEWTAAVLLVLVPVLLISPLHFRYSTMSMGIAGVFSGIFGTILSVSGAPMTLVVYGEAGKKLRSTMAGFFIVGTIFSLGALFISKIATINDITNSVWILPGGVLGVLISSRLSLNLKPVLIRNGLIILTLIGAVSTIVRLLTA